MSQLLLDNWKTGVYFSITAFLNIYAALMLPVPLLQKARQGEKKAAQRLLKWDTKHYEKGNFI